MERGQNESLSTESLILAMYFDISEYKRIPSISQAGDTLSYTYVGERVAVGGDWEQRIKYHSIMHKKSKEKQYMRE